MRLTGLILLSLWTGPAQVLAFDGDRAVVAERAGKPIPCRLDALTLDIRSGARVVTRCDGRLGDTDLVSVVEAALTDIKKPRPAGAPRTLPPYGARLVPFPVAALPSADGAVAHDGGIAYGRPTLIRPVIPAGLPPYDGSGGLSQVPDPLARAVPVPRANPLRGRGIEALRETLVAADSPERMNTAVEAVWAALGPEGARALANGYWLETAAAPVRAALSLYDALWRRTQDGAAAARLAEAAALGRGMRRDPALARRYLAGARQYGALREAAAVSAMLDATAPPG